MLDSLSFWNGSVSSVHFDTQPKFFPGTRLTFNTLEQKLEAGESFTKRIRPELRIVIEPVSYTIPEGQFNGHAIVVKGPNAHYVCHSVRQAARQTKEILRSYNRLVRERNLRDRMRVFDTTGEG